MTATHAPIESAAPLCDCAVVLAAVAPERDAGPAVLRAFAERVQAACPGRPLRWVFTGGPQGAACLRETLAALRAQGVRRVALQPLHCIPGREHAELAEAARALQQTLDFSALHVGAPLLADAAAVQEVARAMRAHAGALAGPGEAVVWVGHGTDHAGQARYEELGARLRREENPFMLTATLKAGAEGAAALAAELTALGVTRVLLAPFFALPGPRTLRDLGGSGRQSWRSRLEETGIACRVIQGGLAEEEAFAVVWLRRLEDAVRGARSCGAAGES